MRVAEAEDFDRVALRLLGEKGFAKALPVLAMTALAAARICPVERKFSSRRIWRASGKSREKRRMISDVAPAPAIDRLIVVADDEEPLMVGGERFEPAILGEVDVLIFVGQKAIEPRGPAVAIFFIVVHGEGRPEQQIAKIGGVRLAQTMLIIGVDARGGAKPSASSCSPVRSAAAILRRPRPPRLAGS